MSTDKTQPTPDRQRISRWANAFPAVAGYVGLAALFAWPLPFQLSSRVVLERGSDFYQHIWNLWWMRFSLFTLGQNPYYTTYLHHPTGQPLTYHALDPLNGVLSLPLQATLGLVAAFNLLRLAHLVFGATAAYALCRLLGIPRLAAWVGGALFAFCPLVGSSFDFGQLDVISVGWLPLYVFCLIKALGNRAAGLAPRRPLWIAGAGLALAAAALSSWYFFTGLVLFTLLYAAWEVGSLLLHSPADPAPATPETPASPLTLQDIAGKRTPLHLLARALGVGAVALTALSPLIAALLPESLSGADYTVTPFRTLVRNSADLLSFFMPLPARLQSAAINPHGSTPALGWVPLVLAGAGFLLAGRSGAVGAGYAAARRRFRVRLPARLGFWLAAAVLFCMMALGPHLLVAGNDTGLPAPYTLIDGLPFLGTARVPLRFVLFASLALAVLAAYGLVVLARMVRRPVPRALLFGSLAALALVELFGIPRTLIDPAVHPFFETVKAQVPGERGAVLELPYDENIPPAMLDQTVHNRPILGGYTSRHYPYPWIEAVPGVAHLTQFGTLTLRATDVVTPQVRDTALAALDYYDVRYVVVHPLSEEGIERKVRLTLETIFEAREIGPIFEDDRIKVYRVPPQAQTGPIVGLGQGWYLPQEGALTPMRATNGQADVLVTNPLSTTMSVDLHLAALNEDGASRTMVVSLDGAQLGTRTVGATAGEPFRVPLELTPGEHWLQLRSPDAPYYLPNDPRPRSLSFTQVAVVPR